MVTQFAKSLPPKLFIHAKQLKIVESVGQGMCYIIMILEYTGRLNSLSLFLLHTILKLSRDIIFFDHASRLLIHTILFTGEYGIVYKAHLTRGGLPKLVAVKTVKGELYYYDVFTNHTSCKKMSLNNGPYILWPKLSVEISVLITILRQLPPTS